MHKSRTALEKSSEKEASAEGLSHGQTSPMTAEGQKLRDQAGLKQDLCYSLVNL